MMDEEQFNLFSSVSFQMLVMPFIFFSLVYFLKSLTKLSTLRTKDKSLRNKELLEALQVGHELYLINLTSIWVVFLLLYYQSLLSPADILGIFTVFIVFLGLSIVCCIGESLLFKGPVKKVVFSLSTGLFLVTLGNRFSLFIIGMGDKLGIK